MPRVALAVRGVSGVQGGGASERSGHASAAGRRETGDVFGPVRLAPDYGGGGFHRSLSPGWLLKYIL